MLLSLLLTMQRPQVVWLESLDLSKMTCGWNEPHRNKSVNGVPMSLGGHIYEHGVGTHANSSLLINLKGRAMRFASDVGVDDETEKKGSVQFQVWVDGKMVASTKTLRGGDAPQRLEVPLEGAKKLMLVVDEADNGIDYDHADWASAQIIMESAANKPVAIDEPQEPASPIYMGHSNRPEINGARTVGCTPGRDFIFKIPASGKMPMRFTVKGLPAGLKLDRDTGIVSGKCANAGSYAMQVTVRNGAGSDHRKITVVCGEHKLAQTPPMGWNSWNVWGTTVTANRVKAAADSFVKENLLNYGYRFVNIDDAWEGGRDADGNIQTNKKFGDMAALASYVHSKGLCLGIYSSPGPKTCAGYEATYQHEQQDANSYAKWGIDYLKYDWCSYGDIAPHPALNQLKEPYLKMRGCLDNCGRDIVFSLCQYGMGDVFKWGKEVGGNLWRTTGDISDSYASMSSIAFQHSEKAMGASPGHWNDPDMLVVGRLGWGDHPRPTHLSPNEQITHITMWSLLGAPLILGCDLTKLDSWTKALITNHEVIDIDQDPLGKVATRKFSNKDGWEVWSRPLSDGTIAVGLMNRNRQGQKITATWAELSISGPKRVRNLWLRQSMGTRRNSLSAFVPAHGAMLFKVG